MAERMQCHHCNPRNSQTLPERGDPVVWSAAFTLGPSSAFNEQSSEKSLVTVGKKAGKQTIKSGHQMTSERTNKIRASNKFHFRQRRNGFSAECSGQIIISDVCQASARSLPKYLQAGSNGQPRVRPSRQLHLSRLD